MKRVRHNLLSMKHIGGKGAVVTLLALLFMVVCGMGGLGGTAILWLQDTGEEWRHAAHFYPMLAVIAYVILFALVIGLYIPGGVIMPLLAGVLFPFAEGVVWASLGNMLGATAGFLLARHYLGDAVQERYGTRLAAINAEIQAEMQTGGGFYLLLLRLAPMVPSPLVNLVMGVLPVSLPVYMLATLAGRLPMTAAYVHAGGTLSTVHLDEPLLSVEMALALSLICLLAVISRWSARRYMKWRADGSKMKYSKCHESALIK